MTTLAARGDRYDMSESATAGGSASTTEREKQLAAEAAVDYVKDGMVLGLGTGSTVNYLLPALAQRNLTLTCVSTSPRTEDLARELGIAVESFAGLDAPARLDLAIDGADQVDPAGWLVKGAGAAHTREKRVAAAAAEFVVIVSGNKIVDRITAPVPLELLEYGLAATLRDLEQWGEVRLRDVPRSPDGGVIADYFGPVDDVAELAVRLSTLPGVIDHGLFAPSLVSTVVVARGESVEHITIGKPSH
jgi:ribose 5-phosphate isomerase A